MNAANSAPKTMALKTRAVTNVLVEALAAWSFRLCDLRLLSIWRKLGNEGGGGRTYMGGEQGLCHGVWLFMYQNLDLRQALEVVP